MMQHITEQHRIEALVLHWKMTAVVGQIVDASRSLTTDIQSNHGGAKHALQVMRDETVATADVEYVCAWRQHLRDLERHVVSSSDLAAASHALEATFNGCA